MDHSLLPRVERRAGSCWWYTRRFKFYAASGANNSRTIIAASATAQAATITSSMQMSCLGDAHKMIQRVTFQQVGRTTQRSAKIDTMRANVFIQRTSGRLCNAYASV